MAFTPHTIRDAEYWHFKRLPSTDSQYPAITASLVETTQGTGPHGSSPVYQEHVVLDRFAHLIDPAFTSISCVATALVDAESEILLTSKANRKGYQVFNHGPGTMLIGEINDEQTGVDATNACYILPPEETYESLNPTWRGKVGAYPLAVGEDKSVLSIFETPNIPCVGPLSGINPYIVSYSSETPGCSGYLIQVDKAVLNHLWDDGQSPNHPLGYDVWTHDDIVFLACGQQGLHTFRVDADGNLEYLK